MEAKTHRRRTLSLRASRWAGYLLLALIVAYGGYALATLSRLHRALDEAQRADTAYQYSQVVRFLYRAAEACQEGRLSGKDLEAIADRVYLAENSTNWDLLSPQAKRLVRELKARLPELGSRRDCRALAAWAERVFPVQVEAVTLANRLRAEIKARIRSTQGTLLFGLGLLLLAAALILYFQDQLQRSQAQRIALLENETAFKSRLLGLVAHELKTPLAAVAGFAELAAHAPDEESRRRHLASLSRASQRMRAALSTFLDLHRLETTGAIAIEPVDSDLAAIARGALEIARGAFPRVRFSAEIPEKGPVARVDPNRVVHALLNLLENAAKYGRGGVALRLVEEGGRVRLEVESEGELDPASAERLFAPFARLQEHRGQEGWGLGLSLVREVAEAHGGRAGYRKGEGRIVFFFELPLRPGTRPAQEAPAG